MAVTHEDPVRKTTADNITNDLDTGGAGTIELQTSGSVVAATLTYNANAYGAASGTGTATANTIDPDTNATGNASPVTKAIHKAGDGTTKFQCSVSGPGGGGDIILSPSNTIGAGDTVGISSLTYTSMP